MRDCSSPPPRHCERERSNPGFRAMISTLTESQKLRSKTWIASLSLAMTGWIGVFFIGFILCMLVSCGQSGHLYLPTNNSNNALPPGK